MAIAQVTDVETRMKRSLSADETDFVEAALEEAAGMIADAAGKDDQWAADLDPVPKALRSLAVTMVVRSQQAPEDSTGQTEQLGAYSRTLRFPEPGGHTGAGLMLSDDESRLVRRLIFGRGSDTAPIAALLDELPDWQRQPSLTALDDELLNP